MLQCIIGLPHFSVNRLEDNTFVTSYFFKLLREMCGGQRINNKHKITNPNKNYCK